MVSSYVLWGISREKEKIKAMAFFFNIGISTSRI